MADRVAYRDRTFKTRLLFIHDIFENKYDQSTIMASCIEYKLGNSFQQYVQELNKSSWVLNNENPLKILKQID